MRRPHLLAVTLSLALGCAAGSSEETGGPTTLPDSSTGDTGGGVDGSVAEAAADTKDSAVVDTAVAGDTFVACKSDSDCTTSSAGKACDNISGLCVPCSATSDLCPPSEHCEGSKCVAGCKADEGCATSGDAGSSAYRCNVLAHTCVECTRDDHCAAGFLCTSNVCTKGCSTTKACPTGESCCSGTCVNLSTDVDNCGECAKKCDFLCVSSACGTALSCKDLLSRKPTATSGKYTIDPDGSGPNAPFDVYCDMSLDGGGWTLLMKLDGTKATFGYSAALWTNTATLNPTSTDLSATEAKLASFNLLAGTDLGLGMTDAGTTRWMKMPLGASTTLYDRLVAGSYTASTVGRTPWTALLSSYSLQVNCNREGTNNVIAGYASVRIGILGNQEGDCGSPDSFIGFGAGPIACGSTSITTGNYASCGSDNGDRNTATFGYVFIR